MSTPPSQIKLHRKSQTLELHYEKPFILTAEYLRVFSPSAEVRGHGKGQEVLQLNKQNVQITAIEPQGNYAIRILFNDGHDSGIYSWHYLHELCQQKESKWQQYIKDVAAKTTSAIAGVQIQ